MPMAYRLPRITTIIIRIFFLRKGDWFKKVSDLEKRLINLEEEKNKQLVELQNEITDLMKHLDFQSAINTSSSAVKEVSIIIFVGLFYNFLVI